MASSVGNAVGAYAGHKKTKEGKRMRRDAQSYIDNFEWQELENPYKNLQVSTRGADLRAEQANITTANSVEALRQGGSRALASGLNRVQQQNNTIGREIAANLDEQQKMINYQGAQDDVRTRQMMERRQADELAGYGQMLNTGIAMEYQGYTDMMNAGNSQSEHNMELFNTFGGMAGGGGMG